jgi:hypothetical protein
MGKKMLVGKHCVVFEHVFKKDLQRNEKKKDPPNEVAQL